ncbi:MAG: STAS domain-containing protein [Planctomycetes bacterium]|nr:STAS domain-containing protein [Planctomycetota bacterium]
MERLNLREGNGPGGIVCFDIAGSLDAHSFEALEDSLDRVLEEDRTQIIVDVEKLEYISSTGAAILLAASRRARADGGRLVLVRPNAEVREVFDLLGVAETLPIVETHEEAFAQFAEG